MSSVGSSSGSGGSGQNDEVRRLREEYRKKEAELVKKHSKEVNELNSKHVEELDRKEAMQTKMMGQAKDKTQESLTQKDMKYKREIEEMRNAHNKQLEKLMQDNQFKVDQQRKTAASEVKQANLGKGDRVNELHSRYEQQHAQESEKFAATLKELRESQKDSMGREREQLSEQHEKQLTAVLDDKNETVSNLGNELRKTRQSAAQRLKSQEIRHMQDKAHMSDKHMTNLINESELHNEFQKESKEGFDQSLHDLRSRMQMARERDVEGQNEAHGAFRSTVEGRIDNQVNRLEKDLERARGENIMSKAREEREKSTQINNIRDAYQTKFDYLEKARQDTLRQGNEINAQNIREIRSDLDKQNMAANKYYLERSEIENYKNRKALDEMKNDAATRQEYTQGKAENRIEKIRGDAQTEIERNSENYKANLEVLKGTNEEEKKEMRLVLNQEKDGAINNIKTAAQKQEIDQQRRIEDLVMKYEKRISEINDQSIRAQRLRENHEKSLVNSLKRQSEAEKQALRIQYEEQNRQANQARDREIQDLNRRHQEKLNDVLNSVKKS